MMKHDADVLKTGSSVIKLDDVMVAYDLSVIESNGRNTPSN